MAELARDMCDSGQSVGPLHILSRRERGRWVCRCLEYGLAAMSDDEHEAIVAVQSVICRLFDAMSGRVPAAAPAPPDLRAAWDEQQVKHAIHLRQRQSMN